MASLSAVSMPTPITGAKTKTTFFTPLPIKPHRVGVTGHKPRARAVRVQASLKEKAITGLTAAALTASTIAPDVAQAAELSPSLKNFLLSIVSGGVVLGAIFGAVIAVANFDPVKRV
uniref:Photosystem II n=1 Tax=Opuntia streptacantha TaxID=393608 RepID=A0A7C9AHW9_OPUST